MAGNGGYDGPNVHLVQYAFDNTWSVDALETYVTHYQPEGVPLRTLRHALGHHNIPFHVYAQRLVKLATCLVLLGHVRSPARVLLELVLFRALSHLTVAEVLRPFFFWVLICYMYLCDS
jgi:hypothetical protein